MSIFQSVDLYCERVDASLWSEPINLATNLAFIVASLLLWRQVHSAKVSSAIPADRLLACRSLAVLIALIGLGSGAFHSFGNRLTALLDVGMIGLYLLVYAAWIPVLLLRASAPLHGRTRLAQVGVGVLGLLVLVSSIAVCGVLARSGWLPDGMPSGLYLGAWLALLILAAWAWSASQPQAARAMAAAAGLFVLSMTARQLDLPLCDQIPGGVGLHWAWHLLNATVLFQATRAILQMRSVNSA